jgi:hypothetical protein
VRHLDGAAAWWQHLVTFDAAIVALAQVRDVELLTTL